MKNKFSKSNIKTLLLSLIIILIGYFLIYFIYNGLADSTSEIRSVEKNRKGDELSSVSDVSQLNIYPWNMYTNKNISSISLKDVYQLDDFKEYVIALFTSLIEENSINISGDDDFERKIYCIDLDREADAMINNKSILLFDGQVKDKVENKIYDVKFSLGNKDQVSFSAKEKTQKQKVDEKQLKLQYKELIALAHNMGQKLEDYLLSIHKIINNENKFYMWSIAINSILNENNGTTESVYCDVFATNSDLVLKYVIDNGAILYLYYDSVKEDFFGFNFQYK